MSATRKAEQEIAGGTLAPGSQVLEVKDGKISRVEQEEADFVPVNSRERIYVGAERCAVWAEAHVFAGPAYQRRNALSSARGREIAAGMAA
jgi:hypothetical protein